MRAEDSAVAQLAASVADGAPIDWIAAEADLAREERRLARHLRLVERISTLYRTLPPEAGEDAGRTVEEPSGPMWGSLVLLERIGEGTSCEVYKAWDSSLHRDVALKLLRDEGPGSGDGRTRVLGEARRLARLRHQHVVQVYGAEQHDSRVGLWMELVEGESLQQIVRARGRFGALEAALIGQKLTAALAAVHGAGLLHRDVKAQNVLRESGGRIVLMDFGTGEELAGTNRLVGTPLYLAPEIFRGHAASVQSDLYSLGVLLFYLVTGEFPFAADSMEQLAQAHAQSSMRRLRDVRPDLPDAFVGAVERALDPIPARRYRSAGEFERALREVNDTPRVERPATTQSRFSRWVRMLPAAAALVLIVVALIVWSGIGSGASVTRLAVLPFTHGPGADAPVIADALTDQLISTLGQVESLQVVDRASTVRFQGSSPGSIASTLGVDAVLQPDLTIVREGSGAPRARVDVRLIAAGTGATMWARSFERELGATPALLADVARAVTQTVNASLRPDTARRLDRVPPTSQAAAEVYFQGLHYLKRLSAAETRLAIEAFERALELDPQHAAARAGLAQSYITLGFQGAVTHAEARALALAQIEQALELDGDSSEARVVSADVKFYYNWDWRGAEAEYQRAIALNGSSARAVSQYARFLAAAGRLDMAVEQASRAVVLNPLSASAQSTLALVHYYKSDHAGASAAIDEALRLDPSSPGVHYVLARIRALSYDIAGALRANEAAVALAGVDQAPIGWRAHLVALEAMSGRHEEARRNLQALTDELRRRKEPLRPEQLARVHLALSETDTALDLIEQAAAERSPNILFLSVDPSFEALRGEPRFGKVLDALARGNER